MSLYEKPREKARLVKQHRNMLKIARPFFAEMFNEEAAVVISEIDAELERLIPEIPYIGSKNNALTDTMEQMTTLLAIYYVLKRHGYSTEEIGSLAQRMGRAWTEQFPRLARRLIGRFYMSVWNRKRAAKKAAVSQERRYAGDFVTEVVAGDGRTYDWGVNYIECGIVKFFRQQGAEEFAPYMCEIDNLLFPAIGIELIRTGTIANGQTHCDFRFKK